LLPQFRVPSNVDYDRVVAGLRQMLWGFFKKLVIADRLAMLVNAVYADPTQHNGVGIMLATVFFAYQIYCDFSGYSDIAIGAARILGYELMTNFDRPYHAASLSNFWHRWHISLSTWFRDYVYIPMGGRRVRVRRWHLNIMIVFTVSGLWHGANWTFVVWGALHGLYLIAGTLGSGLRQRVGAWLRMDRWPRVASHASVVTTFGLVCIAWIFFRANNMGDALYCLTHLAEGVPEFLANLGDTAYLSATLSRLGMSRVDLVVSCCSILFLELVESLGASSFDWLKLGNLPRPLRWAGYYALVSAILLLGSFSSAQDFIYFQF
jgi:D-alanyl-lipoteichoic acid acyltransferase DltB (MBOAT superfamily)